MKFPLKHKRHDLSTSMRGQGKRSGGMIKGAMAARTGVSLEIDVSATFGLAPDDADVISGLSDWDFRLYHKLRNDGLEHEEALSCIDNRE